MGSKLRPSRRCMGRGCSNQARMVGRISTDSTIFDSAVPRVASASAEGSTTIMGRSEEHTSELQSLMRISYAVFCLKKTRTLTHNNYTRLQITTKVHQNNRSHKLNTITYYPS